MAKLADDTERYEKMVVFMEKVAKTVGVEGLTVEERDLLSVAYHNVFGARRASWCTISSIEKEEESCGNKENLFLIKECRGEIEMELSKICNGILGLLDSYLLPISASADSKVYYLKMKGDYHRYLAEFKTGREKKDAVENTRMAYKAAQSVAVDGLEATDPIRLGLALNSSIFYQEILNSPRLACKFAKQEIEEATPELDSLSEDGALKMQLLREHLTRWTSDLSKDVGDQIKEAPKADNQGQ